MHLAVISTYTSKSSRPLFTKIIATAAALSPTVISREGDNNVIAPNVSKLPLLQLLFYLLFNIKISLLPSLLHRKILGNRQLVAKALLFVLLQ